MAAQNKTTEEVAIKQIQLHETTKQVFTTLRRVMEPNDSRCGLASIKIPINENETGESEWETILDVTKIEQLLLERNRKHYVQADGTPFTRELLRTLVGESGTTLECNEVLNGTHNTAQYAPEAKAILDELK